MRKCILNPQLTLSKLIDLKFLLIHGEYIMITLAWIRHKQACTLDQLEKGLPAPPRSRLGAILCFWGQSRVSDLWGGRGEPAGAPCSLCRRDPLHRAVGFSTLWNKALQIVMYSRSAFTGNLSQFVSSLVAFILTFIVPQTCLWCLLSCSYKGFSLVLLKLLAVSSAFRRSCFF